MTFTFGGASMILPIVGLLTLFGADFRNPFWLKCAGLVLFAIIAGWLLHRIENDRIKWPVVGWVFSASYFLVFISILWRFFDGASQAFFLFGLPELAGLITSLIGLINSTPTRRQCSEQGVDGNPH